MHKALWVASPRNETVPWKLASSTMFAPKIRISVPRSDIEHSSRHLTRVKMGESIKDYDLLMIKFWMPLSASTLDDDLAPDAEPPADPNAAESKERKSEDKAEDTAEDKKEDKNEGADGKGGDGAKTAAANGTDAGKDAGHSADSASFVYLVARASPKLNLWPHPQFKKNKKKQARIMGQVGLLVHWRVPRACPSLRRCSHVGGCGTLARGGLRKALQWCPWG